MTNGAKTVKRSLVLHMTTILILIYSDIAPTVFFIIIVINLYYGTKPVIIKLLISTDPVLFFSYILE